MKKLGDFFPQKIIELDLGRGSQLTEIQTRLDELYKHRVRAKSLNSGVLTLTTPSAAVATDMRLQQTMILKRLTDFHITTLRITIC